MVLRLFGRGAREQVRGLIGLGFVLVLGCMLALLIVQPEYGAKVTSRTLNMDIVSALISLLTLFAGYLAGDLRAGNTDGKKGEAEE